MDTQDNRIDYRNTLTLAIDPMSAKDFDDAVSYRKLQNGDHEVGIHIADVSHFVKLNSQIDIKARERANSVYLVNKVIHMLPKSLSENKCSLKAGEDKLTFSIIFILDNDAKILKQKIVKTIINVNENLSYKKADDIIKNKIQYDNEISDTLQTLMMLSKKLQKQRKKEGTIIFYTTETEFIFDKKGKITDVKIKEHLDTMSMIEEFMLLANKEIATFISQYTRSNKKTIGIYRVHEQPDIDRVKELNVFLKTIGSEIKIYNNIIKAKDINKVLNTFHNTHYENMVNMLILGIMSKAVYTHRNIGHFSLSFKNYTHFTSPIRRYTDIMVHRILASIIHNKSLSKHDINLYKKIAKISTEKEIEAIQRERDSTKEALTIFFKDKVGKKFVGEITGVTEFGLFISESNTKAEGLVHINKISNDGDYYIYDKKHFRLIGKKYKKKFQIGQTVKIKLKKVNIDKKQINWEIIN